MSGPVQASIAAMHTRITSSFLLSLTSYPLATAAGPMLPCALDLWCKEHVDGSAS
jgi:hypothetical protein